MIIGEDFEFADTIKTDTAAIRLLTGPYKDVVYRYTKMKIIENGDDTATLNFDYELLSLAEHYETTLRSDSKFTTHIGLILNTLILDLVDHTLNTQEQHEHRTADTEESDKE